MQAKLDCRALHPGNSGSADQNQILRHQYRIHLHHSVCGNSNKPSHRYSGLPAMDLGQLAARLVGCLRLCTQDLCLA